MGQAPPRAPRGPPIGQAPPRAPRGPRIRQACRADPRHPPPAGGDLGRSVLIGCVGGIRQCRRLSSTRVLRQRQPAGDPGI
ncbi:hypothetical protein A6R68_08745 [Neotoma lepida]|uniref:Uncharacterized protein n=1 Tax=Neotoma lepida TaxID=56216 RepID=A0A1A6G1Q5_NEOLE|nr:hypothetical protein A6R68_08745 [Neotoma lepida]